MRGETFKCGVRRELTQMSKFKLPRFPPRKARNSPRLINFLINQIERVQPINLNLPAKTRFNKEKVWEILTITSLQRTSISRKTRDVREIKNNYPSGESILRWLKKSSPSGLNKNQEKSFLRFLDMLPGQFQQARKKGMILYRRQQREQLRFLLQ